MSSACQCDRCGTFGEADALTTQTLWLSVGWGTPGRPDVTKDFCSAVCATQEIEAVRAAESAETPA